MLKQFESDHAMNHTNTTAQANKPTKSTTTTQQPQQPQQPRQLQVQLQPKLTIKNNSNKRRT